MARKRFTGHNGTKYRNITKLVAFKNEFIQLQGKMCFQHISNILPFQFCHFTKFSDAWLGAVLRMAFSSFSWMFSFYILSDFEALSLYPGSCFYYIELALRD